MPGVKTWMWVGAFLTVLVAGPFLLKADESKKLSPKERAEIMNDYDRRVAYANEAPVVEWMQEPLLKNPKAEASGEAEMQNYTEQIPGVDVRFDMIAIPGGKFTMGSPESEEGHRPDEGPQVEVEVEPFWMGKCEVTWNEYSLWEGRIYKNKHTEERGLKEAEGRNLLADSVTEPSVIYQDKTFDMGYDGYPAIAMSQYAARRYCKWLSAVTGHYYRLPTEIEWEYACRAGTMTAYSFGDDPKKLRKYAWYFDNAEDGYEKVGTKKPNPWGLHDMHGNASEWCLDAYQEDRLAKIRDGADTSSAGFPDLVKQRWPRVVRGGSWWDFAEDLRSAARSNDEGTAPSSPEWSSQDPMIPKIKWECTDNCWTGFRVVRPLKMPTSEESLRFEGPSPFKYEDESTQVPENPE